MKIRILLLSFSIFIAAVENASACAIATDGAPVCAYWTRADAVFSGKALKVEEAPKSEDFPAGARKVRFQVQKNFKGADNPTFTVAVLPDCGLNIKSGQSWIVYVENDIVVKSFSAIRAVRLDPKIPNDEQVALENIANGKSDTAITGHIGGALSEPVEIAAAAKGKVFSAKTDASGAFNLAVPPHASYKVELKFPFRTGLKWADNLLNASLADGTPTVFRYEVRLGDGDCHFGDFEVLKTN
jgi:hypothetical protein